MPNKIAENKTKLNKSIVSAYEPGINLASYCIEHYIEQGFAATLRNISSNLNFILQFRYCSNFMHYTYKLNQV
jgi:hypothetical protein